RELKTDGGRNNKEYKIKGSEKVGGVTVNLRMRRDTKIERYALQHLRRGFLVVKEVLMNKGLFNDWVGEEVRKIKEINIDYFKHGDRRIVFKVTTDNRNLEPFVVKWVYRPGEARPINEQLQDMMRVYQNTKALYGDSQIVVPLPGNWTDDTYTEGYLEGLERDELIKKFAKQRKSIAGIARIEAKGLVRDWRATQDSSGKGMIFLDHHGRDVLFVKNDNDQYLAKFFDFEFVEKGVSPAQMIFYYMKKSRTLFDLRKEAFYQGILEGLGEKEGVEFLERALSEKPDLPELKEFLKKLQTGSGTLKPLGIRTERNRRIFQKAKVNEGLWLKQASEIPLKTRTIKGEKIIAKFITDDKNLPQGLWGYHYRDRDDNLIIITRSEYQDEAAYHEAREAVWINELQRRAGPNLSKEEISHQAHILASAEQSLQFAIRDEAGNIIQPTPLHQEMFKRKTPTELQDIINEDRTEQHNLIRNYLGEEAVEEQKEYEGVARGRPLQNILFELAKKMPEHKVNTEKNLYALRQWNKALREKEIPSFEATIREPQIFDWTKKEETIVVYDDQYLIILNETPFWAMFGRKGQGSMYGLIMARPTKDGRYAYVIRPLEEGEYWFTFKWINYDEEAAGKPLNVEEYNEARSKGWIRGEDKWEGRDYYLEVIRSPRPKPKIRKFKKLPKASEWMRNTRILHIDFQGFGFPKYAANLPGRIGGRLITFKEIRKQIGEWIGKGFNTFYLMCILNGAPFSPRDLLKLNPELGAEEEFKALVDEIHKYKGKVIIDFIYHIDPHTSSEVIDRLLKEGILEYFIPPQDKSEEELEKRYPKFALYTREDGEKFMIKNAAPPHDYCFWPMFQFNLRSQQTWDYLIKVAKHYARKWNVDGARLDAADRIYELAPGLINRLILESGMIFECEVAMGKEREIHQQEGSTFIQDLSFWFKMDKLNKGGIKFNDLFNYLEWQRINYPRTLIWRKFLSDQDKNPSVEEFGEKFVRVIYALIYSLPNTAVSIYTPDWETYSEDLKKSIRYLIQLKEENPALIKGERIEIYSDKENIGGFVCVDEDSGNKVLFVANIPSGRVEGEGKKDWANLKLPVEELGIKDSAKINYPFNDLMTGEECIYSGAQLTKEGLIVELEPYNFHI
ncbi:MAG: hypothetical protein DRP68_06730, partial [Candidatus Omnitrophota bacterium]